MTYDMKAATLGEASGNPNAKAEGTRAAPQAES